MFLFSQIASRLGGKARPSAIKASRQHTTSRRYRPLLETLEARTLLASTIVSAAGAGPGGGPEVLVRFDDGSQFGFFAFDPAFQGGVSVALGNVLGNSVPDVIVGAGPGGGPAVTVFDGDALLSGVIDPVASFFAFDPAFSGGVTVAAGMINGTGFDDVVVGAGPGGGPAVVVFDGASLAQGVAVPTASFFAFDPGFTGGVTVATGQINGTGHDDVIVGAGPGGGPSVVVFDGASLAQGVVVPTASFFAFDPAFTGGVFVASADFNGLSYDDLIVGAGPGGGPSVVVYDSADLADGIVDPIDSFFAFDPSFDGGVHVGSEAAAGLGTENLVVGEGPGDVPQEIVYDGSQLLSGQVSPIDQFLVFDPTFTGGDYVS